MCLLLDEHRQTDVCTEELLQGFSKPAFFAFDHYLITGISIHVTINNVLMPQIYNTIFINLSKVHRYYGTYDTNI